MTKVDFLSRSLGGTWTWDPGLLQWTKDQDPARVVKREPTNNPRKANFGPKWSRYRFYIDGEYFRDIAFPPECFW